MNELGYGEATDASQRHDEASLTGGLSRLFEGETTNSKQVVYDGLETMNDVLARLVKPFESAKTAAPVMNTDPEHEVAEWCFHRKKVLSLTCASRLRELIAPRILLLVG
ncbi:hypothetical protein PsorP6_017343 [Peronosclerospora sorghi]|uniref:Uncharacterized protein n=1 Tax=Peronosclerospora sorghi TaxID=230839 RepID=A0ACC0WLC2_9STRA|nr:hypothetical protein PsorP6_017343 [Peronosclerospora sorghi]